MLERYIHQSVVFGPYDAALTSEQRASFGANLPRGALRRISDLGLLMGAALTEVESGDEVPVVMGTGHSESCALEAYMASFPNPSPTRFQISVHPSSVQQSRVPLQQPLRTYIPMTGKQGLGIMLLRAALQISSSEVIIIAGEEVCPTLAKLGVGSLTGFSFGLRLSARSEGAIGRSSFDLDTCRSDADTEITPLFKAIQQRTKLHLGHPDIGEVSIDWA